uniref:Uncharacterized protein n=1 Tax=Mola mola TaxID=94237 RepID=A0A3Q4BFE5_MOLML
IGKQQTRKLAVMKRMISLEDQRIKEKDRAKEKEKKKKDPSQIKEREVPKQPSHIYFLFDSAFFLSISLIVRF